MTQPKATREPVSLRADARQNRERIIAAAAEVFAERGLRAPLEEVAHRAGVGIGTLYRRFPSRQQLVEAIFEDLVDEFVRAAEEAAADKDAWRGFCTLLERTLTLQAANRGLKDVFAEYSAVTARASVARAHVRQHLENLMERAKEQGALRNDVALSDVSMLFWACSRIVEACADIAPNAWRRHLTFVIEGFHATTTATTPLPAPPLTDKQLQQAMAALRERSCRR